MTKPKTNIVIEGGNIAEAVDVVSGPARSRGSAMQPPHADIR